MADDKNMSGMPAAKPQARDDYQGRSSDTVLAQNANSLRVINNNDAPYNPGEHERPAKRKRGEDDDPTIAKNWHKHSISTVKPDTHRVDKDKFGNIHRPPTSAGHFDHTEGGQTLANDIAKAWKPNSKFTVLYMEHHEGDLPVPPEGSSLTLPMLPHQSDSAWAAPARGNTPADAEQCANCGRFGHRLIDCCVPSEKHGDIFGCPICNTRRHSFDNCPNQEFLSVAAKFNILCYRRAGKPMIRSDYDVYDFARRVHATKPLSPDVAFPWTREGTLKIFAANKKMLTEVDYSGDKARLGQGVDNWATFATVIEY
ncbi:hypothetical protein PG993_008619 [Apiospora rasikravindrae]|uniref:CCHC-type domain-containing protein n=1 Tax=Apiospora rasikravindrae TaxID=990691 RepID=A0ABR1T0W1_9PEZI